MKAGKHISMLLFLVFPVLCLPQQAPAAPGQTGPKEHSTPSMVQAAAPSPSQPAASEGREGRVRLDVVVTNWLGMQAAGLDVKDFKLLDNSQPAQILSFHAADGTDKTEPPVEVILLIDAMNTPQNSVAIAREAVEKFLRQKGGRLAQPVSLYMLSNDGISVHAEPSVDGNALAGELSQADSKLPTIRSSTGARGAFELFQQSIEILKKIVASEGKKPGRKLLIWASAGWQLFDTLEFFPPEMRRQSFETIVELSTSLREGRITLYGISTGREPAPVYYKNFVRAVRAAENAGAGNLALGVIAEQSGGRVLGPYTDLLDQINNCVADASVWYSISLDPPPTDQKNEYHELKVEIDRPRFSARTSAGYYNQPAEDLKDHAGLGPSAPAARRMSIQQFEELQASVHNQPDELAAKILSGLELTERVTSARLSRWQREFSGKQSREALLALAAASAFLDLPSSEILQMEMPDVATRKQILSRAVEYVRTTVHTLPNFLAWRKTTHFEDLRKAGLPYTSSFYLDPVSGDPAPTEPRPLKVTDRATTKVTYRDGYEVADAGAAKHRVFGSPGMLLTSSGEFGPILSVVMEDAIRGQVYWSHWEQGPTGPAAVLRYVVPQEISNFGVSLGSIADEAEQQCPAYYGEIAIDPASGSILRLTVVSEFRPPHWVVTSSIAVEYGPVTIGRRDYICPLRSEALFRLGEVDVTDPAKTKTRRFLTYLNDVSFTDYHLFRGDVHILP